MVEGLLKSPGARYRPSRKQMVRFLSHHDFASGWPGVKIGYSQR